MKAPFFIPGTMTTHSALSSTPPGTPLSGAAMISSNDFAASAKRSRSFSAPETPPTLRHTMVTTKLAVFIARFLLRWIRWGLDYACSRPRVQHVSAASIDGCPAHALTALELGTAPLFRPRPCSVEAMPAGGAEPERLQTLFRDLRRVDLRELEATHSSRAKSRQQLHQTGPAVLDERAERHNLRRRSARARTRL